MQGLSASPIPVHRIREPDGLSGRMEKRATSEPGYIEQMAQHFEGLDTYLAARTHVNVQSAVPKGTIKPIGVSNIRLRDLLKTNRQTGQSDSDIEEAEDSVISRRA